MIKDKQGNILADLRNTSIISKQYPIIFNSSGNVLSDYIIYGNTNGVGDYNSTSQKYIIPVTIHSKNLFNANNATLTTSYPDNINGQFIDQLDYCHSLILPFSQGVYTFSLNCPTNEEPRNRNKNRIACYSSYPQVGDNCLTWTENYIRDEDRFSIPFCAPAGTAYISIFLWASNTYTNAYIADVIANSELMIEPGNEFTSYIAYNTNTINLSLDSALTANQNISKKDINTQISTYKGTNLLTIGTTVQPSNVLIKGNINYAESSYFNMHRVRFYNQDGSQLLYTEYVPDGKNAHGWALTPSKASTNQYTYNFVGWNIATGQTAATANVLNNIITDKDVYAAFQQVERTFTVQFFYDENASTPLQTVENVPYGGTAAYTGSTPTKTDHTFIGWDPSPTNVTEDISCYAQFIAPYITDSWEVISQRSDAGTAQNYYSVGDCKPIVLNGTMGTLALNTTLYVYILGFNHNSNFETLNVIVSGAKGPDPIVPAYTYSITFGCFKTAATNGVDIALCDSMLDSSMSHKGKYNYGGWKGSDMRYDILGSTDVQPSGYGSTPTTSKVGYDASSTCATNPVANTLMSCLPSDLRAVMKPVKKYTDNKGNKSNTSTNVTSSIDYLPLLSEFEIQGVRKYANQYEQNKQAQYAYYIAGNSKIKYNHSSASFAVKWWARSPCYDYSSDFCCVSTYGFVDHGLARQPCGVAPCFLV